MTAVINYSCPTPNTNIVIFGGKILDLFQSGGGRSEMNGLSSWSFAGMGGGGGTVNWRTWTAPAQESQVYSERLVWVPASLCRDLTWTVYERNWTFLEPRAVLISLRLV